MKHLKPLFIACFALILVAHQGLAQNKAPNADIVNAIRDMKTEDCRFLEVSQEMFRLMSNAERAEGKIKEYFNKINHLVFLQCHPGRDKKIRDLANEFEKIAQDNHFRLLMRSEARHMTNLFFKREDGDVNEYLLATQDRLQFISTTLDITSIREMTQIISIAGDAGGI